MAKEHAFVTLDVFTDQVFSGNPLAVICNGEGLDTASMQAIAREFNLSETTFILPPDDPENTHRVRIFTPVAELDFAGHPTLGTAIHVALADPDSPDRHSFRFEEGVGVVPVSVTRTADGLMRAELSVAALPDSIPDSLGRTAWAEVIGLPAKHLCPDDTKFSTWTCGAPFAFVPVAGLDQLAQAGVNLAAWARHLKNASRTGIFVFTESTDDPEVDIRARMFDPAYGIAEDPATGSAVAALAGWLATALDLHDGTHRWIVEQGVEMGRPSRLELSADIKNGAITGVRVAGTAVPVSSGRITVP